MMIEALDTFFPYLPYCSCQSRSRACSAARWVCKCRMPRHARRHVHVQLRGHVQLHGYGGGRCNAQLQRDRYVTCQLFIKIENLNKKIKKNFNLKFKQQNTSARAPAGPAALRVLLLPPRRGLGAHLWAAGQPALHEVDGDVPQAPAAHGQRARVYPHKCDKKGSGLWHRSAQQRDHALRAVDPPVRAAEWRSESVLFQYYKINRQAKRSRRGLLSGRSIDDKVKRYTCTRGSCAVGLPPRMCDALPEMPWAGKLGPLTPSIACLTLQTQQWARHHRGRCHTQTKRAASKEPGKLTAGTG